MFDWFTGIWPFIAHAGAGGSLIGALLAAAWFSPVFKKDFVYAALVVGVATFIYGVGVHDEKHRRDALDAALQQRVEDAVKNSTGKVDPYDDPRN